MQGEFFSDFCASEPALSKRSEQTEVDSGEQDFGVPKTESGLENCVWCWRGCGHKDDITSGTYGYKSLVNSTDSMFELGTRPLRLNKRELTDALLVFKPVDDQVGAVLI
jgi:hypothetical protein